jgi:hypothetical protein
MHDHGKKMFKIARWFNNIISIIWIWKTMSFIADDIWNYDRHECTTYGICMHGNLVLAVWKCLPLSTFSPIPLTSVEVGVASSNQAGEGGEFV